MCGRFTIKAKTEQLREAVRGLTVTDWRGPRYNVAPTQPVPVVRNLEARVVEWIRWGLVPGWAPDLSIGNRLINARAETLAEKPAFRNALRARRCVILADGFYEWAPGRPHKQPYFFQRPGGAPFALAGLWEAWQDPAGGAQLHTCTIITTQANERMSSLHERMPVILPRAAEDDWLAADLRDPHEVEQFLHPYPDDEMRVYPVSTAVNNTRNNGPQLIEEQE